MPSNWQQLDIEAAKAQEAVKALEELLETTRKFAANQRALADAEFQRWQNDETA